MTNVIYPTLKQHWLQPQDQFQVKIRLDSHVVSIPLTFLAGSNTNTWAYVTYCIRLCVNEDGYIVDRQTREQVNVNQAPNAGEYEFVANSSATITLRCGPEGKSRRSAPTTNLSESTFSRSSRATNDQASLRTALVGRDFSCIVSGAEYEDCIAAHIIPYSRLDIWARYYIEVPFHVSCGLLLSKPLHSRFDKFQWSLYNAGDGTLIVHYFTPTSDQYANLHGKVIPRSAFRIRRDNELPDPRFLEWHYTQCVLMNIRGRFVANPVAA